MSPNVRPLAADDAKDRAQLARALRQIRPTLILVCDLGAVRIVAPTLRADLVQIVDRVTSYLDGAAGVAIPDLTTPADVTSPADVATPAATAELTWHIYAEGKTECGRLQGPPHTWPVGHVWVRRSRASEAPVARRCSGCWK